MNNTPSELAQYIGFSESPMLWEESYNQAVKDSVFENFSFNQSFFERALDFYRLSDNQKLKEQLAPVFERLFNDKTLQKAVMFIHHIMFQLPFSEYKKLWTWKRNKDDMFPALISLCGFEKHLENMKKRGFDDTQINYHIQDTHLRLSKAPDLYGMNGLPMSSMVWGGLFQRGEVIQIGSLQYQLNSFSRDLPAANDVPQKGDLFIALHIQRGQPLDSAAIDASLRQAPALIKKYFPETAEQSPLYYACHSWLLGQELRRFLPENSNIRKFQDRFRIFEQKDEEDGTGQFLFNVMSKGVPVSAYEARTSLQKAVKQALLEGVKFRDGLGILK